MANTGDEWQFVSDNQLHRAVRACNKTLRPVGQDQSPSENVPGYVTGGCRNRRPMQVLPNDSDGHDVEYRTFAFCVCSLNLHVNLALVRAFEIIAIVPVRLHGRLNDGIFRFLFCNL